MPESLVLLHGFASTRRLWDPVIGQLPPERYNALALDLPGHGSQARARTPVTFDGCVEHVLARAPERFALAGYSMGGRVALHIALEAPQRVHRLVLVSATAGIDDAGERAARSARDRRLALELERGTIEDFIVRWRSQAMFAHDPPALEALARREMRRNRPEGLAAALRGIGTGEMSPLWGRLVQLQVPVTLVAGERDGKFCAVAERMARSIAGAQLITVAGAGHVLPLERPQAVASAIG